MGVGRGMGFQIPIIAVQNNTIKAEVSIVTALVVFSQNLGGAVFLSLDQIIFSSSMTHYLSLYTPTISYELVAAAGAAGIRTAVPARELAGVLLAYNKSFDRIMYMATGAAGGTLLSSLGMRWMNIKKKAEEEKHEASASEGDVKAESDAV
jgi:hypothetical protein